MLFNLTFSATVVGILSLATTACFAAPHSHTGKDIETGEQSFKAGYAYQVEDGKIKLERNILGPQCFSIPVELIDNVNEVQLVQHVSCVFYQGTNCAGNYITRTGEGFIGGSGGRQVLGGEASKLKSVACQLLDPQDDDY